MSKLLSVILISLYVILSRSDYILAADTSEGFIEINMLYQWQPILNTHQVNQALLMRSPILLQSSELPGMELNLGVGMTPVWALTIRTGFYYGIDRQQTITYQCNQTSSSNKAMQHCHKISIAWEDIQSTILTGIRYQPYDEYSPLLSLESGVTYAYSYAAQEMITDVNHSQIYQGRQLASNQQWDWMNRLGFAFLWRWDTNHSITIGSFINYKPLSTYQVSYGIQLCFSVYHYLPWW